MVILATKMASGPVLDLEKKQKKPGALLPIRQAVSGDSPENVPPQRLTSSPPNTTPPVFFPHFLWGLLRMNYGTGCDANFSPFLCRFTLLPIFPNPESVVIACDLAVIIYPRYLPPAYRLQDTYNAKSWDCFVFGAGR